MTSLCMVGNILGDYCRISLKKKCARKKFSDVTSESMQELLAFDLGFEVFVPLTRASLAARRPRSGLQ